MVNVESKTLHGELRLEHSTSCEHSFHQVMIIRSTIQT